MAQKQEAILYTVQNVFSFSPKRKHTSVLASDVTMIVYKYQPENMNAIQVW